MNNDTTTRVRYGVKFTKNLGSYESITVDINVDDYVREDETVSKAFERVTAFVDGKVIQKVEEIGEDVKGKK